MVEQARLAARKEGVANVGFAVGDAYHLADVDLSTLAGPPTVVHAHQLLQHLARLVDALRQMAALLADGGMLAVRDADYSAMTWYPRVPELERWREIYLAVARHNGGEPDAGRRLLSWAQAAGLTGVEATADTWCFSAPADREWWGSLWADRTTSSDLARQAKELGLSDDDELEELGTGWRAWAQAPDGWFAVLHGRILAHVTKRYPYGQTQPFVRQ